MITKHGRIVCDRCGKFVAYADLQAGTAHHEMNFEWDYWAEDVNEVYYSNCRNCTTKKRIEQQTLAETRGI